LRNWLAKSLRHKAVVALVLLGIVPLLISGIIINIVTNRLLTQKMSYMAQQTIQNLSLSISQDLQSFVDVAFYESKSSTLRTIITDNKYYGTQKRAQFYSIYNELYNAQIVGRLSYPYHYLLVTQGDIFTSFSVLNSQQHTILMNQILNTSWYSRSWGSHTQKVIISADKNYLTSHGQDQIYISANILIDMDTVGILNIGIDRSYLSKLLEKVRFSDRSSIYIVNNNDCIIEGDSNYLSFNKIPQSIINSGTQSMNFDIDEEKQFVTCSPMYIDSVEGNWKIIMVTPAKDITKGVSYINYIIIGMIVLSILAVFVLIMLINQQMINPVLRLNKYAKEVEHGNLDVYSRETSKDEIGQLALVFNNMVRNIKQNIANIQEEEKIKRQLEMDVLQSQINPHFIRNTLNIVRWMAEMMGAPSISKALISFVRLIDYNYGSADAIVSVRKEIESLEEYIYLQKLRYQNKFTSKLEIDGEICDYGILKLVLQPIIENSIVHGFEKKKGVCFLSVKGFKFENNMIFEISDNGIGMSNDVVNEILKFELTPYKHTGINGIGLANVQMRMHFKYGEDYNIKIQSTEGQGTTVTIMFPIIKIDTATGGIYENINS